MNWCEHCGLCCMHVRTPPFYGEGDPTYQALPPELKKEIHDWVMTSPRYDLMVKFDGEINPCIWLDLVTGKCKHYDLRPEICRDYEVGNDSCRSVRQKVGLTVKGMPVSLEAFELGLE